METLFTVISLLLSLIAIAITYLIYQRTQKTTVQPVIVFSNVEQGDGDRSSWCIENVGNGPALNVLVAGGNNKLEWHEKDITMIPVIGCDNIRRLWLKKYGALLATYKDIYGREYTSICVGNRHSIKDGNSHPHLKPKVYDYQIKENRLKS